MRRTIWVALLLVALGVAAYGCARTPAPAPPRPRSTRPPLPGAGVRELAGGKVRVRGVARYVEIEGGFWRIEFPEQRVGSEETTHIVLVFPEAVKAKERTLHDGQDVEAVGKLAPPGTVSFRMAGPELTVESLGVRID